MSSLMQKQQQNATAKQTKITQTAPIDANSKQCLRIYTIRGERTAFIPINKEQTAINL